MIGGENFFLHSNEFGSNIKTFWQELQIGNDYYDMTLACEDKQIKTHKVVISSCSPVLRNILKLNQNQHPLIYLRGVKYDDLQNLLTFMYQGEVTVAERDLPDFLEVAEDLVIRGLSEGNTEGSSSKQEEPPTNDGQNTSTSPKKKRTEDNDDNNCNKPSTKSLQTIDSFIENTSLPYQSPAESQSTVPKKEMNEEKPQSLVSVTSEKPFTCDKCDKLFTLKHHLKRHNETAHEGVCYSCSQCEHKATTKSHLKVHIQSVHQRISVTCDKCDKQFSSNAALWKHNSSVHEGLRYPCHQCDYKATQSGNLHKHKLRQHKNEQEMITN